MGFVMRPKWEMFSKGDDKNWRPPTVGFFDHVYVPEGVECKTVDGGKSAEDLATRRALVKEKYPEPSNAEEILAFLFDPEWRPSVKKIIGPKYNFLLGIVENRLIVGNKYLGAKVFGSEIYLNWEGAEPIALSTVSGVSFDNYAGFLNKELYSGVRVGDKAGVKVVEDEKLKARVVGVLARLGFEADLLDDASNPYVPDLMDFIGKGDALKVQYALKGDLFVFRAPGKKYFSADENSNRALNWRSKIYPKLSELLKEFENGDGILDLAITKATPAVEDVIYSLNRGANVTSYKWNAALKELRKLAAGSYVPEKPGARKECTYSVTVKPIRTAYAFANSRFYELFDQDPTEARYFFFEILDINRGFPRLLGDLAIAYPQLASLKNEADGLMSKARRVVERADHEGMESLMGE